MGTAHLLQQVEAGHRLHVPVGDHQVEFACLQLGECFRAVIGVFDILETELPEKIANDADHGVCNQSTTRIDIVGSIAMQHRPRRALPENGGT